MTLHDHEKRALARFIRDRMDGGDTSPQEQAVLNVVYAIYEYLDEVEEADLDITIDEAENILVAGRQWYD